MKSEAGKYSNYFQYYVNTTPAIIFNNQSLSNTQNIQHFTDNLTFTFSFFSEISHYLSLFCFDTLLMWIKYFDQLVLRCWSVGHDTRRQLVTSPALCRRKPHSVSTRMMTPAPVTKTARFCRLLLQRTNTTTSNKTQAVTMSEIKFINYVSMPSPPQCTILSKLWGKRGLLVWNCIYMTMT